MKRFVFSKNGETREFATGIGFSLLIHLSLALTLMWLPLMKRTESRSYILKAYRVHLLSAKEVDQIKKPSSPGAPERVSKARAQAQPVKQPIEPLYPVKKVDIPDLKAGTTTELALKPLEPAPEITKEPKKNAEKPISWEKHIPVVPVKRSAEKGIEAHKVESDAEYGLARRLYYSEVWRAIQKQWALPVELLSRSDLEAVIVIKVRRDGKILSMRFEKKSGNALFDDSAWKAVQKANPLPPFPRIYSPPAEEIGIRFRPELAGGSSRL